ncbi:unnamed protein product [Lampetra fluviatilis]
MATGTLACPATQDLRGPLARMGSAGRMTAGDRKETKPHLENLGHRGPKEKKAPKVALEHLEVKVCKVLLVSRGCPGQRETRVRRAFPEGMEGQGQQGCRGRWVYRGSVDSLGRRVVLAFQARRETQGLRVTQESQGTLGPVGLLERDHVDLREKEGIQEHQVIYNRGNHYNSTSGKFQAALAGVHNFAYSFNSDMDVCVGLYKNGEVVSQNCNGPKQSCSVNVFAESVLLEVEVGDSVWLELSSQRENTQGGAENKLQATFSGVLVFMGSSVYRDGYV